MVCFRTFPEMNCIFGFVFSLGSLITFVEGEYLYCRMSVGLFSQGKIFLGEILTFWYIFTPYTMRDFFFSDK